MLKVVEVELLREVDSIVQPQKVVVEYPLVIIKKIGDGVRKMTGPLKQTGPLVQKTV